jgi:hypothetical protein
MAGLFWLCASLLWLALPATASNWVYTVVEGDNLWDFSTRHLDSTLRYEPLRRLNNIEFPKRMRPGTRIRVPMKWIRSNPVEARVAALKGEVTLLRAGDGDPLTVQPETPIGLGDTIRTAANSSVAIRFADESVVTLHQNSRMHFDHLSAHGKTGMVDSRLRLIEGRLDTRVTPAVGPGSRFEIQTPSAISAVRGTEYRAAVAAEGSRSNIEVIEGRVTVSGADKARLVRGGFGTQITIDEPPSKPKPLLPPPRLEPIPERIRELNWALRWQAVDGASAYRVEIGVGDSLDVLAWEQRVDRPRLPLPDLADGDYRVRVRAIDADGLEGRDRIVQLTLDTHPRPPVPLQPAAGKVLRGEAAELRWSASADAASYLLEISADSAFEMPVARHERLSDSRFDSGLISEPGTYYWRISSIADDGEIGPASDVRHWVLKAKPEKVEATLSGGEDGLVASWRAAREPVKYQVQLAFDSDFGDLEFDRLTTEPRVEITPVQGQVRYLRVRIVEEDGYLGPWGTVQRIDPVEDPTAWYVPVLGVLGILLL